MNMLITIDELKNKRSRDLIPCECKGCNSTFYQPKNVIQRALKGKKIVDFCSKSCFFNYKRINSILHLKCEHCHKDFDRIRENHNIKNNRNGRFFCCKRCANEYYGEIKLKANEHNKHYCQVCNKKLSNKHRLCFTCKRDKIRNDYLERWLLGLEKGYYGETYSINPNIRRFLFKKYSDKCCKCGWSKTHPVTNRIPLEVNHIDGNAQNCKEENLELICPNCHSLTSNFRRLNEKSCRKRKS